MVPQKCCRCGLTARYRELTVVDFGEGPRVYCPDCIQAKHLKLQRDGLEETTPQSQGN